MNKITQAQASQLSAALATGRAGTASLTQLAQACDLAARIGANQVALELRARLHAATSAPLRKTVTRDVVLGLATGALTHHLLRGV